MPTRRLWTCPRCQRSFTRPGQTHSCGRHSVAALLQRRPRAIVELYRGFVRRARTVGPVRLAPARTRIGLQNRRIFAAVNRLADDPVDVHLVTSRRLRGRRFRRVDALAPDCFVHHVRIASPAELDLELLAWLRLAYAWGLGSEGVHPPPGRSR